MADARSISFKCFSKISENERTSVWCCKECNKSISRVKRAGWTNTFNHVKAHHPEYKNDSAQSQIISFTGYFTISPAENTYAWVDWVTDELKPFPFVTECSAREYTRLKPICVNTLKKYMSKITKKWRKKITDLLTSNFSILLDGWTKGGTHYFAIFACYPDNNVGGYSTVLLL